MVCFKPFFTYPGVLHPTLDVTMQALRVHLPTTPKHTMSSTSTLRLQSGHQVVELRSGTLLECMVTLAPASAHADGSSGDGPRSKLAVCLHPWSWLGGRMDDPCVIWTTCCHSWV